MRPTLRTPPPDGNHRTLMPVIHAVESGLPPFDSGLPPLESWPNQAAELTNQPAEATSQPAELTNQRTSAEDAGAAVDDEMGTADPGGLVRAQEHRRVDDVVGAAVPAERDPVEHDATQPLGRV